MTGALDGIRVLEFASYVSGPYAGMLLGDLGAEVIKMEPVGTGDPFRDWGAGGYSPTFDSLNRNKKSVALDLKSDDGQAQAVALAKGADVLVENYRPGTLDRLGLGWEVLAAANPGLIYCSITGFGPTGPDRERPGYDTVGQAMGGLLSLLTDLDDPRPMGFSFSDHLAGTSAAYGILGALVARGRTGRGQRVETSLLEATVAYVAENATRYFDDGKVPDRATRTHIAQVYAFTDCNGLPFIIHLSSPPKFWEGLTRVVGREDWREDARFAERRARIANYDQLHRELAAIFGAGERAHWLTGLLDADVPASPIHTLDEVFDDPQVQHLAMRQTVSDADRGELDLVRSSVRLSDTPAEIRACAPTLGEHTDEVLGTISSR